MIVKQTNFMRLNEHSRHDDVSFHQVCSAPPPQNFTLNLIFLSFGVSWEVYKSFMGLCFLPPVPAGPPHLLLADSRLEYYFLALKFSLPSPAGRLFFIDVQPFMAAWGGGEGEGEGGYAILLPFYWVFGCSFIRISFHRFPFYIFRF